MSQLHHWLIVSQLVEPDVQDLQVSQFFDVDELVVAYEVIGKVEFPQLYTVFDPFQPD